MPRHPQAPAAGRRRARVLVLGGGFAGATVTRGLGTTGVTLVSNENALLFTPMLPEVASGTIEPRHVVVPLRQMCPHADLVLGEVSHVDTDRKTVVVSNEVGELIYSYDHLVIAMGAVSRTLPIPGLADHAVGFKTFYDAVYLRDHVLRELELADNEQSRERAASHLGFVFVGAGYAGVEALAELHDLVQDALRDYPSLRGIPHRWLLVEAQDRILPAIPTHLGEYATELLAARGIEIHTNTRLNAVHDDRVELSGGQVVPAHTVVWSAGVAPHPLVTVMDLPTDRTGRIKVDAALRVEDHEDVWALGDIAQVVNVATPGVNDPPTSQHAIRQGRHLARNLKHALAGEPLQPYGFKALGQVATLGRYRGIADVLGLRFSGMLGWLITRTYHVYAMPLLTRRIRVLTDWTLSLFFRRDVVAYGGSESAPKLRDYEPPGTEDLKAVRAPVVPEHSSATDESSDVGAGGDANDATA
ncbi:MAG TPA: NAD(P)/FAD-dependent oxidoreductase [Euzebyales bacterium]|nr:NAD(P)/FAD-dependent oxidoreductase [Euzebyales bacterium]